MAATPYSNVINLQPGGQRATVAANRILLECRDMAARRLREALRDILKIAGENLQARGDVAKEMDERRFLYALHDKLKAHGGRLEGQLVSHWGQAFDAALTGAKTPSGGGLLELQIVDYSEMDESLAVKALARRLQDKCDEELYALGRRFAYLVGKENATDGDNPLSPDLFLKAFQDALRDTDFDTRSKQELYSFLEGCIEVHIGPVYHVVNAHLVQRNVLPSLKRDYGRAASQAPHQDGAKKQSAGDMFSLLQGLMSGAAPGQAAPVSHGMSGPMAAFAGQGMAGQGMAVPAPVMNALDAMQFATPGAVASQPSASEIANVLHHFRASEVGQGLGQLDAITVDIVAMLFDMIFDDREISDPIKVLVSKLQIPVLKVAMLDKSFFASKAHPTRRLLDLISRAALRWTREVGREDPIYRKIAEVIDHVHDNFKQDTALFEALCSDLEHFLAEQEDAAAGNVSRAAGLVIQRELEELAAMAVDSELQLWLVNYQLPRPVHQLLDREWRALLRDIHLKEGPDSQTWETALATVATLVDSVLPKRDGQERQALARQLPQLIKQLSVGFDRLKVDGERRHALLDALFSLHAASLRGAEPAPSVDEPVVEPPLAASEPDVTSRSLDDGEVTVESISISAPHFPAVACLDVETLQRGDWVEYIQADGSAIRYRLSWISPQRGIFLFTNPQSPHAIAVSPEAMSLQVQRGEVRVLSTEPIFDRALTRTIDILQAA